ncbi:unnamed protein product [Adineta ricciae]|uniref:Uncharacterized protein n=1 Tax=Adineta ricciae TaxID=249248 RepID=A0A814QZD8_ADIRI|nr:unnamed protein product [Adineta ricciae]
MATSINMMQPAYTDAAGKPIGNDVHRWFQNGVKPVGVGEKTGPCTTQTTCYIFLGIICFLLLCIIIIVPLVLASVLSKS